LQVDLVIEFFSEKLQEKDNDLAMASEIGKALVDEHEELMELNSQLSEQNDELRELLRRAEADYRTLRSTMTDARLTRSYNSEEDEAALTALREESWESQMKLSESERQRKELEQKFDRLERENTECIAEKEATISYLLQDYSNTKVELATKAETFENTSAIAMQVVLLDQIVTMGAQKELTKLKSDLVIVQKELGNCTTEVCGASFDCFVLTARAMNLLNFFFYQFFSETI
jgi:DNA repair exonuclease SbcCD ATPase subunit